MDRIFAIGDIHGEFKKLENLINILFKYHALNLSSDKLIFMGDYIDRGPNSYRVLKFLFDLQKKYGKNNVITLAGNHEYLMLDFYDGIEKWSWLVNGGGNTLKSFPGGPHGRGCPKKYLEWIRKMPLQYQDSGFFFSHAPIPNNHLPGSDFFTRRELTWSFWHGLESDTYVHPDGVIGVCGHWHALKEGKLFPRIYPHYIFTDAGCGCSSNAPLCAVEVKSRVVFYSI